MPGTGDHVPGYGVGWGDSVAGLGKHPGWTQPGIGAGWNDEEAVHGPTGGSKEGGGGAGRHRAGRRDARRVKNPTQGTWFATQTGQALTRAIAAAHPGDRLNVFGRCRGGFSIEKDLRIFGNINRQDPTVLDGAGGGGVLLVNERVTVSLTRLTITGNTAAFGGGILSVNTLTLNQTTVSGNVPDDCAC